MRIRLTDQSTCRVEGIIDDIYMLVQDSYVMTDFVVLNTSHSPKAPIIMDRPFLRIAKATIYAKTYDIRFNIDGKKEMFSFSPHETNKL